jgi:hypothetical protein
MFAARNSLFTNGVFYDPDAQLWISAVESSDSQALETGVKTAMNQLVLDLKSNSLWSAITTMAVTMGARTLNGAIIDIKDPSTPWTSVNFVSGDYNRTTGLVGNASTKHLDTGISDNIPAQNSFALWTMVSEKNSGSSRFYAGSGTVSGSSALRTDSSTNVRYYCRNNSDDSLAQHELGLIGMSRSASGTYSARGAQTSTSVTRTSQTPVNRSMFVLAFNSGTGASQHGNGRIRAAAMGSSHDLATAETVMNTYIAAITALGL